MKLSQDTLKILKNYSDININLTIEEGNQIKTIRNPPTIYSEATIAENFPKHFGIYDLKEFLSILSMFGNPDLNFEDDLVTITDEDDPTISTKYWRTADQMLARVPKMKEFPPPTASWRISALNLTRIEKSSLTLKCPDIVFEGNPKRKKIIAKVCNLENGTKSNDFTVVLDDKYEGNDFSVHIRQDKFIIINGDYHVDLIGDKLIQMKHETMALSYAITVDLDV